MKERILAFLKSTFSESDGSASASRVLAGCSVGSTIVWVSYIVFRTHTLPDLTGAAMFLSAGFSGYAVNQATRFFKKDPRDGV